MAETERATPTFDRVIDRAFVMLAEAYAEVRAVDHWRMSVDMWRGLGQFSRPEQRPYRVPREWPDGGYSKASMLGLLIIVDEKLPPRSLMLEPPLA